MKGWGNKMKIKELEDKYGKELINKILDDSYLNGCTVAIIDEEYDIPESDIRLAIRETRGDKIGSREWD
jgi:hypothetical protein